MELDLLQNSKKLVADNKDEYLAYNPNLDKFKIVKDVNAQHWSEDAFFVHEIFNGCNPMSVRLIDKSKLHEQLHPEFFHLEGFKPEECEEVFLVSYEELRNYCYPTYDNLKVN
jgi:hypothetical protein